MDMIWTLFDIRFDKLISRSLLGVVYALALGLHLLAALGVAIALIASGGIGVLLGLVAAIVGLIGALVIRLAFEAVVVYFRAAEDVHAVRDAHLSSSRSEWLSQP